MAIYRGGRGGPVRGLGYGRVRFGQFDAAKSTVARNAHAGRYLDTNSYGSTKSNSCADRSNSYSYRPDRRFKSKGKRTNAYNPYLH